MKLAFIYLHVSIFLAGFTGVFGRLITMNEALLVWYRVMFASGFFLIYFAVTKTRFLLPLKDILRIGWVGTLLAFNANRMNRIVAWIPSWLAQAMGVAPEVIAANAEKDANYQLANALVAIRNGGVTGAPGLFKSLQKQEYLPEAHTDFIFAIGAEEWGLVFSLGLLALYVTFFVCGVYIAHRAPDRLGRLFAFGMTFLVFFQAMFNLGVVTGCLPTKGLALPFVSYGGTNLITAMLAVGVLVNIGGQMEPRKPRPRTTRAVVCRKRS